MTRRSPIGLLASALVLLPALGMAQEEPERNPGGVEGGYDPAVGLFVADSDAGFKLSLGAYSQFRYSMNWREDRADSVQNFEQEFSIPRTEIFLEGSYTDRLDFQLRTSITDGSDFELLVAYLAYRFSEDWNVTIGKQFIPLSREDWQYAQDLLAIDFSANDNTFASGTALGLVLNATIQDWLRFWIALDDGSFSAKRALSMVEESDALLSGRFEFQIAGTEWSVWDDLIGRRGRPFSILIGIAPAYLVRTGEDLRFGDEHQLNLDLSLNGDGYQVLVAGSWTARNPRLADRYNNYGLYAQGGYFVSDTWQLYGRYDFVSPGDQPALGSQELEDFTAVSAGLNWLPFRRTNRWKISAEVGYLFSALNNTIVAPSGTLGWLASDTAGQTLVRLQAQFGF
ncbi:MAG: OprO/OprP family phosphate-selective porin [marine benthic group bacterium]|nr:OprO/OprP family phosphate-selective porin [Gemmatimonadota bacterium]